MRIRPHDLREPRFRQTFHGVSRREVRDLLGSVAADLEATMAEVDRLRSELAEAGATLIDARGQDREATRLLSQAEADGRRLREEAERQASEAVTTAEARVAAMLHELEAERDLLAGRIAQCQDHQRRIAVVLQDEVNDLQAFLNTEPTLEPTAVVPAPVAEPASVGDSPPERPGEDATWSADDVQRALAAATARRAAEGGDDDPAAGAGPAEEHAAGESLRGRLVAAGLAAAVAMIALASPGSRHLPADLAAAGVQAPAPRTQPPAAAPTAASQPQPAREEIAPAAAAEPAPPVPDGAMRVEIEAVRPCWIRLTEDGRSEERVLQAGEALVRDSRSDLIIRAGNAGALVVTIDGRTIPPLGREGEIVTRRLTRDMASR